MSRVLFHYDCFLTLANCGFVRVVLGGLVPADRRQSAFDGGVLVQKEDRLRERHAIPISYCSKLFREVEHFST